MKNNFTVRRALSDDLADIQRLNFALFEKEQKEYDPELNMDWTYGPGAEYFKNCINDADKFAAVAQSDGRVVGYLCGSLRSVSFRKGLGAELDNTFIEEKYRSNGIGAELMAGFIDWCSAKNVDYIRLSASSRNRQAIHFYKQNGFQEYDVVLQNILSSNKARMATKKEEKDAKREEFKVSGHMLLEKFKELVKEGNVRRIIIISEKGETLMEIPLTFAVVGTALAPVLAAVGALAALIANCTIVVERK